jgi:hypothetical protein
MADRQTASASASLDALRVTIARSRDAENALEVTINPDAVTRLRPASDAPVSVRVFLVVDGVATVIYDDVTPRDA